MLRNGEMIDAIAFCAVEFVLWKPTLMSDSVRDDIWSCLLRAGKVIVSSPRVSTTQLMRSPMGQKSQIKFKRCFIMLKRERKNCLRVSPTDCHGS